MMLQVTSTAFAEGQPIPKKYTGEGTDVSPPLAWSGVPATAKELALVCDDPDAPRAEPWVHWVIYKIPVDAKGLPEGVSQKAKPKEPAGAVQGKNSWDEGENTGYRGPMPPPGHGVHHYHFKLYALDAPLEACARLGQEGRAGEDPRPRAGGRRVDGDVRAEEMSDQLSAVSFQLVGRVKCAALWHGRETVPQQSCSIRHR